MVSILHRFRYRAIVFLHDILMIPAAWLGAYWLRFNLTVIPDTYLHKALAMLPVVMVAQAAVFWYLGLYRGVWRFASMPDLARIARAVVVGTALALAVVAVLTRLEWIPRSVFPLYGLLLVTFLGGPRFIYRWIKDYRFDFSPGGRALVVGAGHAGEMLVRDLLRATPHDYRPVAFVDDDPAKGGKEIHGVRVRGDCRRIADLVQRHNIDIIFIAVPAATSRQMRRIVELCSQSGVPFRTLPRLKDLVTGKVGAKELRDVAITDLLGREPVSLDWESIRNGLSGKIVLVSGSGGSIGSELCRQLASIGPREIVLLENSEHGLYAIEIELRRAFPHLRLHARLGDVCDPGTVEVLMEEYHPQVVFHAAAYKHVPMLEYQVREAARNNILGTRVMLEAADRAGVDEFVLISTDKAVNPTNIMGATKRIAEMLCESVDACSQTRFITVRFGNVLDSAGSVVPLFREQIAAGGPVTVTHPEISRYFMTIPEACQLIMQAAVMGRGGEIFVLDMGEPVPIRTLAEQMIRLSGKVPGEDIEIVYTGLRPGEKLHEELFHGDERITRTERRQILLANHRPADRNVLEPAKIRIEEACGRYDEAAIREIIARLVPEWAATETGKKDNVVHLGKVKK